MIDRVHQRARSAALAGAILAVSAAGVAGAPGARAALVPQGTSGSIGLFSPDWKDINRSEEEWLAAARNFDVLIGMKEDYEARISQLHQENPSAVVLMYNLGPYLLKNSQVYAEVMATHPEYFARDLKGSLITVRQKPSMTLMDQGNPDWRAFHAARVKRFVERKGFDGVYVDCMGPGAVQGYTTAKPVNRATGTTYTTRQWLDMSVLVLNQIKAAVGPRFVMFNGLGNGPGYKTTKILATSAADGGMVEGFVRDATSLITQYPAVSDWLSNVEMMKDMNAKGKAFFGWTKTWTDATDLQRTKWNTFALATYLLTKGPRAYYNFLPRVGAERTTIFYPNQQASLGAPLGEYTVSGDVYSRRFERGRVTVNPAARTAEIKVTG